VNAHAVADGKLRRVASLLFFLDGIDNLIHDNIPFPPAGRANIFIRISSKGKRKMGHENWLVWKSAEALRPGRSRPASVMPATTSAAQFRFV
jgi:hypothetical protein